MFRRIRGFPACRGRGRYDLFPMREVLFLGNGLGGSAQRKQCFHREEMPRLGEEKDVGRGVDFHS